jgi:hypothetical protein
VPRTKGVEQKSLPASPEDATASGKAGNPQMGYDLKPLGLLSLGLSIGLVLTGCISAPELLPPREAPAFVRDLKFIRLYGHVEKMDTGIDVAKATTMVFLM